MKAALGKGLDALIPDKEAEIIHIDIHRIRPNKYQPRKTFDEAALNELTMSIKEKGILQPVIVSRTGDGSFDLIAGERRWRAAGLAGLKKIPALIKNVASEESLEIALIENIQREDLNPIETAEAFNRLMRDFHLTQEALSEKVGKERATVANYLRLLKLPDEIKADVNSGLLSMGHARALLAIENKGRQLEIAGVIKQKGLSVRESEKLAKKSSSRRFIAHTKDPQIASLEEKLKKHLATKVKILHNKSNRGKIIIEYYSLDELDRMLEILLG